MPLSTLVHAVPVLETRGDVAGTAINAVVQDHAAAAPGALFCCVVGSRVDGHDLAGAAVEAGAVALLCERFVDIDVAQLRVAEVRPAIGPVASTFHGHPSRRLTLVGVTGTNGKTTTAHLVRHCLEAAGHRTGWLGTMTGERTTPEASELQSTLAGFVAEGFDAAAIEVSSVGLARHRIDGTWFAAGVFTNLSPDELMIHGTVDSYFEAKASLFLPDRCGVGVVNEDDEWGRLLLGKRGIPMRPFRLADAQHLDLGAHRSRFTWRGHAVDLALAGDFNVMNALAAATAAHELGMADDVVAQALSAVEPLAGHASEVDLGQPFRVVVDFAHSGGALEAVLRAVRPPSPGRVLVVFGCGGDRDTSRRPIMGAAAARHADVVVLTSDNPRGEDPKAIIDAIARGAAGARELRVEPDRRAAIHAAVAEAKAGDVVVIAGKGHETGQIIGDAVVPFDDREVAGEAIAAIGERSG